MDELQMTAEELYEDEKYQEAKDSYTNLSLLQLHANDMHGYAESTMIIADCCFQIRLFDEGYSQLGRLLEFLEDIGITDDHALVLETRHNMANGYVLERKHAKALEQFQLISEIDEKNGVVNKDSLVTKASIAMCLSKLNKYDEALKLYRETLQIQKDILPSNHEHLVTTKNNISTTLSDMGRHEEALELLEENLAFKQAHGKSDVGVKQDIVKELYFLKRYTEALKLSLELKKALPDSQPYKLLAKHQLYLARIYTAVDDYQKALNIAKVGKATHEALYEKTDRFMLNMLSTLADCYAHMDQFKDAIEILEDIEGRARSINDIKGLIYSQNDLANVLTLMGKPEEALPRMEFAEKELIKLVGSGHPHVKLFKESKELILKKISK